MSNLKFSNNWRRMLAFGRYASHDVDTVVKYVALDVNKIPMRISKFCSDKWNEYGFDFDTYSYLLWPVDDEQDIHKLAEILNNDFPGCARVVEKTIAEAHGLSTDDDDGLDDWI